VALCRYQNRVTSDDFRILVCNKLITKLELTRVSLFVNLIIQYITLLG